MAYKITSTPQAEDDLIKPYIYIADKSGHDRAKGYIDRIKASCSSLSTFPARGKQRDDIRPGLRVMGFERRATIVFHIKEKIVYVDRILYGGRSLERAFAEDE